MKIYLALSTALLLAACSGQGSGPFGSKPSDAAEPAVAEPAVTGPSETRTAAIDIGTSGKDADALDQTSAAEREAALTTDAGGAFLGETVASLGDPGVPGFWLKTPLVEIEAEGRVELEDGAKVTVTLMPIPDTAGAGSEISLAAMRALGLSLTDLPNLKVFR